MGYEVDFLAVGEGEKSGDAIIIRAGDLRNPSSICRPVVIVIDGGYAKNGEEIVSRIKQHDPSKHVDIVVSTHPDSDHISGLQTVLEECSVSKLWMHLPWNYAGDKMKESLPAAWDLYSLAKAKNEGIIVQEPFAGLVVDSSKHFLPNQITISVLGPDKEYYERILNDFEAPVQKLEYFEKHWREILAHTLVHANGRMQEIWDMDSLHDLEVTSAKNNSSVVLRVKIDGDNFLFTADAGIESLSRVASYLEFCGDHTPLQYKAMQIPHHGSSHNIGPTVLNRLLGNIVPRNNLRNGPQAIVSCAKDGEPKHPNKRVLNAYTRRGANCYKTGQRGFCVLRDSDRKTSPASLIDFYEEVEGDE